MKKEKQRQKQNITCNRRMRKLLFLYVDGSISRFNARRFERHIQKCPKCAEAFNISFGAIRLTAGLRSDFVKASASITNESTAKAKANLMQSLSLEHLKTKKAPVKVKNYKKIVLSFASVVVVFAVLIPLAIRSNLFSFKSMNKSDSSIVQDGERENYSPAVDNALAERTDELICESSILSFLDNDLSEKFIALTKESEYCWKEPSESFSYIGVFLYPSDFIKDYEKSFKQIFQNSSTQPDIRIISREKSQKLVEYTGEQSANVIKEKALDLEADILIISIER